MITHGLCRLQSQAGVQRHKVLVFDLGGGTFDTVLLERSSDIVEVWQAFE
jgi:molecular chaperone DnaK (HSP70)